MKLTRRQMDNVRRVASGLGMSDVTVATVVSSFLEEQSAGSDRKKTRTKKAGNEKSKIPLPLRRRQKRNERKTYYLGGNRWGGCPNRISDPEDRERPYPAISGHRGGGRNAVIRGRNHA